MNPLIWWCEEHEANAPHDKARCWYAVSKMISLLKVPVSRCSLVEKRIVNVADQVGEPGNV